MAFILLPPLLLIAVLVSAVLCLWRWGRILVATGWIGLVLLLAGGLVWCTWIDPDPTTPVDASRLVGTWRNGAFTLTLAADGSFAMPVRPALQGPRHEPVLEPRGTWRLLTAPGRGVVVESTWHQPHRTSSEEWSLVTRWFDLRLAIPDGDPDEAWYEVSRDR